MRGVLVGIVIAAGGLMAYEVVVLVLTVAGSIAGLVAIVWLAFLTRSMKEIQAAQGARIKDLPPPPRG